MVKRLTRILPRRRVRAYRRVQLALLLALVITPAHAQEDPNDPFGVGAEETLSDALGEDQRSDDQKSVDELLAEGEILYLDQRLLDARTKWLKVLEKDPKQYRAHIMLSTYYLAHVGHFRLALKYVKQAQALFEETRGAPPYEGFEARAIHTQLLSILSQARLNLDDYQGALTALDELKQWDYIAPWYAGSRAWILMKLGRLQEAIAEARQGYMFMTDRREKGQILNMLGILLSMDNQRSNALQVFDQAIRFEFSQGDQGEPATPLNNSGEVYKEIFEDDKAETNWLKAVALPDGCEHVLPSLNLALLYIEQLNLREAKRAMDRFEACVAKFPLRNGEEHRALVHLARGRVDLLAGNIDPALEHFEAALSRQQWFGKIGTNPEDLQAGALSSMADALRAKQHWLNTQSLDSLRSSLRRRWQRTQLDLRAWWNARRARQILAEDLNSFEDLSVRHTDSMLEYPTLGTLLSGFSERQARRRIEAEQTADARGPAKVFYQAYLGESALRAGKVALAEETLKGVLRTARPRLDEYLKVHVRLLLLEQMPRSSADYQDEALRIYREHPALLRNRGLCLPVNIVDPTRELHAALDGGPFCLDSKRTLPLRIERSTQRLEFVSKESAVRSRSVTLEGKELSNAVNELSALVFRQELGEG